MVHAFPHSRKTLPSLLQMTSTNARTGHTPALPLQSFSTNARTRHNSDKPFQMIPAMPHPRGTIIVPYQTTSTNARSKCTPALLL
ncbi:MAG: hypothetical protein ACRC9E_10830 [Plesiomonas shigelloides]